MEREVTIVIIVAVKGNNISNGSTLNIIILDKEGVTDNIII